MIDFEKDIGSEELDYQMQEQVFGPFDARSAEEARERNTGLAYEESLGGAEKAAQSDHAVLATYNLQVIGPEGWVGFSDPVGVLGRALEEAEENISDVLPEGFYVKIREWDDERD